MRCKWSDVRSGIVLGTALLRGGRATSRTATGLIETLASFWAPLCLWVLSGRRGVCGSAKGLMYGLVSRVAGVCRSAVRSGVVLGAALLVAFVWQAWELLRCTGSDVRSGVVLGAAPPVAFAWQSCKGPGIRSGVVLGAALFLALACINCARGTCPMRRCENIAFMSCWQAA